MTPEAALSQLRSLSEQQPAGPVRTAVCPAIVNLLEQSWTLFSDSHATTMQPWKLKRAEGLTWDPPCLSFKVERHGAVVLGSKWAEIQGWEVNLADAMTAQFPVGRRKRYPPKNRVWM
jgi:hypothetical protein